MEKEKTLKVEIAHEIPERGWFCSRVDLPAAPEELEDAFQRARVTGLEYGRVAVEILGCEVWPELIFYRMDTASLDELQFFAERLSDMDSMERTIFKVVAPAVLGGPADGLLSVKDMINCTYGLGEVIVAADVCDDEQLGRLVIETEMDDEVNAVPEHLLHLLDTKKIGETQRNKDKGVYVGGLYIAAGEYELPEVYDGKTLPSVQKPDHPRPVFELELRVNQHRQRTKTVKKIALPAKESEVRRFMNGIAGKHLGEAGEFLFVSSFPQIMPKHFSSINEIESWNRLAQRIQGASSEETVLFKAVLSAERPKDLKDILDIMDNLHRYELLCDVGSAADFFKLYLSHHLDDAFDCEWLSTLLPRAEGEKLLKRLGAAETVYGVVSGRGRALFEAVRYAVEDEVTEKSMEEAGMNDELEWENLSGRRPVM